VSGRADCCSAAAHFKRSTHPLSFSGKMLLERDKKNKELQAKVDPHRLRINFATFSKDSSFSPTPNPSCRLAYLPSYSSFAVSRLMSFSCATRSIHDAQRALSHLYRKSDKGSPSTRQREFVRAIVANQPIDAILCLVLSITLQLLGTFSTRRKSSYFI
jgi:hypothetical protein